MKKRIVSLILAIGLTFGFEAGAKEYGWEDAAICAELFQTKASGEETEYLFSGVYEGSEKLAKGTVSILKENVLTYPVSLYADEEVLAVSMEEFHDLPLALRCKSLKEQYEASFLAREDPWPEGQKDVDLDLFREPQALTGMVTGIKQFAQTFLSGMKKTVLPYTVLCEEIPCRGVWYSRQFPAIPFLPVESEVFGSDNNMEDGAIDVLYFTDGEGLKKWIFGINFFSNHEKKLTLRADCVYHAVGKESGFATWSLEISFCEQGEPMFLFGSGSAQFHETEILLLLDKGQIGPKSDLVSYHGKLVLEPDPEETETSPIWEKENLIFPLELSEEELSALFAGKLM